MSIRGICRIESDESEGKILFARAVMKKGEEKKSPIEEYPRR